MSELRATALVLSQLLFTVFGAMVNIMLGITLRLLLLLIVVIIAVVLVIPRDLPNLASATFYVLLANVAVCNLVICTLVKTILSIYLGYAYLKVTNPKVTKNPKLLFQDQYEVDLQFCPTFTFLHWITIPVLPATLFALSWSVFYFKLELKLGTLPQAFIPGQQKSRGEGPECS